MKNIIRASSLVGAFAIACGAPTEEQGARAAKDSPADTARAAGDETAGEVPDVVEMPASDATTDSIGVVRWGASQDPARTTIRGYDATGTVVAKVEHVVTVASETRSDVSVAVSGKSGAAKMQLTLEEGAPDADGSFDLTTTMTSNTFADGDGPSKVLDASLRDHTDGGASWRAIASTALGKGGGSGGVALGTKALHPTAETSAPAAPSASSSGGKSLLSCVDFSISCIGAAGTALYSGASAAKSCVLVAKDVALVARCVRTGAAAGTAVGPEGTVAGGILGGVTCGSVAAPRLVQNGKDCFKNAAAAVTTSTAAKEACTKKECKKP